MDPALKIDVLYQLKTNVIELEAAREYFERHLMPTSANMFNKPIKETKELINRIENDNTK